MIAQLLYSLAEDGTCVGCSVCVCVAIMTGKLADVNTSLALGLKSGTRISGATVGNNNRVVEHPHAVVTGELVILQPCLCVSAGMGNMHQLAVDVWAGVAMYTFESILLLEYVLKAHPYLLHFFGSCLKAHCRKGLQGSWYADACCSHTESPLSQ